MFGGGQWKVAKGNLVIARGKKRGTLYIAEVPVDGINSVTNEPSQSSLWHQRLGHMSDKGMKMLVAKGKLPELQKVESEFCEPCIFGKKKKVSFVKTGKAPKAQKLELVHTDVFEPTSVSSLGGAHFYVTFIDDSPRKDGWKMEKNDTGCQASLEAPILCVNNCGFFGTPATMNMCSKCHKDMILNQEQAKLAASSNESIVNGNNINKESAISSQSPSALPTSAGSEVALSTQPSSAPQVQPENSEKPKEGPGQGPSRCTTCRKRVGLTGFSCRCGNVFCSVHRYSDKHGCRFDYRATAKDAIAKANPVVKAEKLDKI